MHVEPHGTPGRSAERIRHKPVARIARRLMAMRLAMLGTAAKRVVPQVLISERQVVAWVARHNAGRAEAPGPSRGPRPQGPLSPEREQALRARLDAGPPPADGVCPFAGEDIRWILKEKFGVVRCLEAVYDLLHRMSLEPLRPRPRPPPPTPPLRNLLINRPDGSPKSPPSTPGNRSRSGLRTRLGSARRGR